MQRWRVAMSSGRFGRLICTWASLAQRLERSAVNRKVAGSIPAGGVLLKRDMVAVVFGLGMMEQRKQGI